MMFTRIFEGLDRMDAQGTVAVDAARMGFLEWVLTLEGDADAAAAARLALCRVDAKRPSPAAQAFLEFVGQAAACDAQAPRRRRGRRRVLH